MQTSDFNVFFFIVSLSVWGERNMGEREREREREREKLNAASEICFQSSRKNPF